MTLSNTCYEKIQKLILTGQYMPGEKLGVERLKKDLDTGHSPIREALSKLLILGLVQGEDRKGYKVSHISEEDLRDLVLTFSQIELLALTQAIDHGDMLWEGEIVSALHQLARIENSNKPVSYEQWAPYNESFHRALISGCPSKHLLKIREQLFSQFQRYINLSFKTHFEPLRFNHLEHKRIAQAVLDRDIVKASLLLKKHMLSALENVIEHLEGLL